MLGQENWNNQIGLLPASGPFIVYIVVITDMMEPTDRFDKESITYAD